MRRARRSLEVFNISFLDIVSCAFGAMVLLVLISKTSESTSPASAEEAQLLLQSVLSAEENLKNLLIELEDEKLSLKKDIDVTSSMEQEAAEKSKNLNQLDSKADSLEDDLSGLEVVHSSLDRASISRNTATKRDAEVGGIPVDSDYIIFIVDTSGSMKEIWNRVSAEVINVLQIHPKVKGFQVLNDMGVHLISGYAGQWIPDTPQRRKSVMNVFGAWNSSSNSSPVEGLEVALKKYAKPNISVSIYIFGDDYSGSSYDDVVRTLDKLNTNKVNGKKLAKVHAIGFISNYSTNRFSILMRELTKRNGGTFLALPYNVSGRHSINYSNQMQTE